MNKFLASLVFLIGFGAVSAQADTLCESNDYRTQSCYVGVGWGETIILTQQVSDSACIEGQTWYQQGDYVTVTNGCRGYFRSIRSGYPGGYPGGNVTQIRCESIDQRVASCPTPYGTRSVRLSQQHSRAACIEGRTWYVTRGAIVVQNGCRATFDVYY